ncbi:MAG: beta-propeller domain-containing protein, partial [Myxococcales bacterium]|nr:beta-propeller domain-containing protein [Myxococcales bacterium]
ADGMMLNLNSYRGLQVIDLADLDRPQIVGRMPVVGTPVEMYLDGDRAVLLLNSYSGYYGGLVGAPAEAVHGGLVLLVDVSTPDAPALLDRVVIPGWIRTSRVARSGSQAALYIASSEDGMVDDGAGGVSWQTRTLIRSFELSTGTLASRDEIDLGGHVSDVQATPQAMLVARQDWNRSGEGSLVSIVDISDPTGLMIEGGQVQVTGIVESQFNMDLRGGILRVVSAGSWTATRTNHLETFDLSSFAAPAPIDHCMFGAGEDLYATLFLEDRAFFVTYFRVDPFHAFSIDAAGLCQEQMEFIVSGWNDFFRSVEADTRLIGVGIDDASGSRTMAVSLYDVTDLSAPDPLLSREQVAFDASFSEASWDHRAFSVIEGAVSIAAADGTVETGLVLLPFGGYDEVEGGYVSAVQIFTFSDHTLTRRGVMEHGSPVRRSFLAEAENAANLSERELRLFDLADPDAPIERAQVDLAPSYTRVMRFGGDTLRLRDELWSYSWWGERASAPPSKLQIVPGDEHPDHGVAVAEIDVPSGVSLYQVGDLLVTVAYSIVDGSVWPPEYESEIVVYDLSDPRTPLRRGSLITDRLVPPGGSYGYRDAVAGIGADCFDCGFGYPSVIDDLARTVQDAIVFGRVRQQSELLGVERICHTYPTRFEECLPGRECVFYDGGITCRSLDGGTVICEGTIVRCDGSGCFAIHPDAVPTATSCSESERRRYWTTFSLDVLNLLDPGAPALAAPIELPEADESVDLLDDGERVFYAYRRPADPDPEGRAQVAYYFRALDLASPSTPSLGAPINVPGRLIAVVGEDVYTRDLRWSGALTETSVHRLHWGESGVALVASRVFADRAVDATMLDGAGHLLVTDRPPYDGGGVVYPDSGSTPTPTSTDTLPQLSILDGASLELLGQAPLAGWAQLAGAIPGRALLQVPGGLMLVDLVDPSAPEMQAYFPIMGWPAEILFSAEEISFAAGPYGIYRFDPSTRNLLEGG